MEPLTTRESVQRISRGGATVDAQMRRRDRVLEILSEGLPALPSHLIELNGLLATSPVDLKRISQVIQSDPSLTGQVIHLCNSALFGLRRRVFKVEEAAILLGTDRLRTLVFTCYLMDSSNKWMQERAFHEHWRHSFTVAILSERVARAIHHPMPDQAYLAGLLHDVGKLPLLMVAAQDSTMTGLDIVLQPGDHLAAEREHFGLDHCEVGRWIGNSWEFYPCHIEVFGLHHNPAAAVHDPLLVGVVSVADHFCERKELLGAEKSSEILDADETSMGAHIRKCLPATASFERDNVERLLEPEYRNVIPLIAQSFSAVVSKKPDGAADLATSRVP
ncbi:MAG TPA: HDOD domain-containing protein [Candidatus Baltobacteraceae bacterium]|nr:HDOD domain-containing protein [Candidatus Baltobacteraceae bacterium]